MQEHVKVMEHYHGKITSGLKKLSQTKKQRYEVCLKEVSVMTGQKFYRRTHESVYLEGGLVPGGFGTNRGRKAVYLSLVSPQDQNPDPKFKPYFHFNHQDCL